MVLGKPCEKIMWPQKNHNFREKCILSMFQMDTHYYNTARGTYQTWFYSELSITRTMDQIILLTFYSTLCQMLYHSNTKQIKADN